MKRILCSLLILLCWSGWAFADNSVTLNVSDGVPGDTVTVQVSMLASDRVVAAEFSVPITEGLSYVAGSFTALTADMSSSSAYVDSELRVYFYSASLGDSQLGDGALFSFKIVLGRTPGQFRVQPSVVFSNAEGKSLSVNVSGADITVLAPRMAINPKTLDFGHIAIRSEYTRTFEIANTGTTPLNVSSITASSQELSVSETSFTIQPERTKQIQVSFLPTITGSRSLSVTIESNSIDQPVDSVSIVADTYSVNVLSVGNASGESDSIVSVDLFMDNMENIAALQCSFALPEGLSYVDNSFAVTGRLQDMKCFANVENGVLKLYAYSESEGFISEGSGRIGSFNLHLGSPNGRYTLIPSDVILGNQGLVNVMSGLEGGLVEIMSPLIDCNTVFDMGTNPLTEPVTGFFRIQNSGMKDLIIERVIFEDTLFSLINVCPIIVSPGNQNDISVSYAPMSAGGYASIMKLYTNVPDNRIMDIDIVGIVFEPNYLTTDIKYDSDRKSGILSFNLSNYNKITAVQLNVYGLESMTVDQSSLSLSERCDGLSSVLTFNDDGSVRVFIYSLTNKCITGDSGELFTFAFSNSSILDKNFKVRITDIVLSDEIGNDIASTDTMAAIIDDTLLKAGDANSDGKVDVADIVSVVNYIYGQQVTGFDEINADVNGNEIINVTDISEIISIISGINNDN